MYQRTGRALSAGGGARASAGKPGASLLCTANQRDSQRPGHHGSEEGISQHRKIKLELFKSQKLLLLPKAVRVRGGLPSTWIRTVTELSVYPFSGSC